MVDQANSHRLENVIQEYLKNSAIQMALNIAPMIIEYLLVLALGYEVNKIFSDEPKDVWTFVEFFGVLSLCALIWMMKCCCLNKFCITCCINCVKEKSDEENTAEPEPEEKVGLFKKIIRKLHLILNRLAVGAVGYEIRKRIFAKKPMGTWDIVEVVAIVLFCIWIFTIKYCILNGHLFKACCCFKCRCSQKKTEDDAQNDPNTTQTNKDANV